MQRVAAASTKNGNSGDLRQLDQKQGKRPLFCLTRQIVGLMLGSLMCIVFACIELSADYPKANDMLAMTAFVACFWAFEVLPLPVTSLFPVVLMPVFGVMSSSAVAKSYGHGRNVLIG